MPFLLLFFLVLAIVVVKVLYYRIFGNISLKYSIFGDICDRI